jgi:8-oxo-dGTP diphosphatase
MFEITVVAGALFDERGQVLIAQRPPGKHLAGGWEFPGGKVALGESRFDALVRELNEELGIIVQHAESLIEYTHEYAERRVHLDLWWINLYQGIPQPQEGQVLKWVSISQLPNANLLEADLPMIAAIQQRFAHTQELPAAE